MVRVVSSAYILGFENKLHEGRSVLLCFTLRLTDTNHKEQSIEEVKSKFVNVPVSLKCHVIGKGGCKRREIMDTTGANLVSQSKEEEGFTLLGDEEQIAHAEKLIQQIVVRTNKPTGLSTSSETTYAYIFFVHFMI